MLPRLLIAIALVVGACTPAADDTTSTTGVPTTVAESSTTSGGESTSSTTTTVAVEDSPMEIPGLDELPDAVRDEIIALIGLTEDLRGLDFLEPPTITVVSRAELSDRVRESIQEEAEEIPTDEALLKLLGLLAADVDLLQLYTDLYGEQVAGFYDGDTGELVVPAAPDGFSALQKATLVHELTHALTDQRFGFHDRYQQLIDGEQFDESIALLSVVEGDATLTEILYIQQLSRQEAQALLSETFGVESGAFDSAPPFLQNSLIFPYSEGLNFVQRLYELGGFDEVNRAYVEPPVSSEQIITPRDYQTDEPIAVRASEPDLDGYEVSFRSVWGELGFDLMLDQVLGDDGGAADGWGGDEYIQWFDGTESAVLIDFTGDTVGDAEELAEALLAYAAAGMAVGEPVTLGFGFELSDEDYAFVGRIDDRVVFVAAGDPVVGRLIVDGIPVG